MEKIRINTNSREYDVLVGEELIVSDNFHDADNKEVLLIVDDGIPGKLIGKVEKILKEKSSKFHTLSMEATEEKKSFSSLEEIHDSLMDMGYSRECLLYAMGGGIICDMTGFAAATYQRGVDFILIPTTLLSQVDASVGGKTAINHKKGKNMIGAFHQPKKVLTDMIFLESLKYRQITDGLSEIIKHAIILDQEFFVWLEENINELLLTDSSLYKYAVSRSIELKESVVSRDETEKGVRKWLNFGHTFGHAIETFLNYSDWIHGEAVSVGILMALRMSYLRGNIEMSDVRRVTHLMQRCSLPVKAPSNMTTADFNDLMLRDKKVRNDKIRLVLLEKLGRAEVIETFHKEHLQVVLSEFCHSDQKSL